MRIKKSILRVFLIILKLAMYLLLWDTFFQRILINFVLSNVIKKRYGFNGCWINKMHINFKLTNKGEYDGFKIIIQSVNI